MKRRLKEKIVKNKLKKYIKEISKYFTPIDIYYDTYFNWGSCSFKLKEESRINAGICNIGLRESEYGKKFFVLPINSYKFSHNYANDHNVSDNIKDFISILGTAINDFAGSMKDLEETEEDFLNNFEEDIREDESEILRGVSKERYSETKSKLEEIIKNLDYDTIPYFLVKMYKKSDRYTYGSIAHVRYYPSANCTDEYTNKLDKELLEIDVENLQWRKLKIYKIRKKDRKRWTVYTKHGSTNLYQFAKL